MPIIAIAGGPHSGKSILAQFIIRRLIDNGFKASIVKNSVEEFFNKCSKENPNKFRYDIDQTQIMKDQYKSEIELTQKDKSEFHVILSTLFCNYANALFDCFKSNADEMKKNIPDYHDKALECTKVYDLIVFLDFAPNKNDWYMKDHQVSKRCKGITMLIKDFLDINNIPYLHVSATASNERSHSIYGAIEKKFDLPRKAKTEQIVSKKVLHETESRQTDEFEKKDPYLESTWGEINLAKKKERTRMRLWNKRR